MKTRKLVTYIASAIVPSVVAALVCKFGLHMDLVMSVFIGIFAGFVGNLSARLVYHIIVKDLSDSFAASEVWYAIYTGLFGWFVFNGSEAIQTMLVFAMLGCSVNAFGFRFIALPRETAEVFPEMEKKEPKKEPSRKDKIAELAQTLRYQFMEDGITPNLDAPLCVDEDGHHLTPSEADAKGLGSKYAEAIEYIKTLV